MSSDDARRPATVPLSLRARLQPHLFRTQPCINETGPFQEPDDSATRSLSRKPSGPCSEGQDLQADLADNSPQAPTEVAGSSASEAQIAKAADWLSTYLQQQRDQYARVASPLSEDRKAQLWPYYSGGLLEAIRFVELHGTRIATPEFFAKARAKGFKPPEISHMESLAFIDVVVFNERMSDRSLFHALVRAIQIRILGVRHYAELWMHGFIRTKVHFAVPLEVHAFSLASRFLVEKFCVEDHVLRWVIDRRY